MQECHGFWDELDPKYRLILCDAWGVIHNGVRLEAGAAGRLATWRSEGRFVVVLTNAPRPTEVIQRQLDGLGMPPGATDAIVSSGSAGIAALNALDAPVGFLGTKMDRDILQGAGIQIASGEPFADLACIGFEQDRWDLSDYQHELEQWVACGVRMHCLNPDRVVVYGSRRMPCAGLIADAYESAGGKVIWYGKPYEPIYRHALALAGGPPADQVLAIGDGLETDMLGAARMGLDAVFVGNGIHAGEAFPANFAERHGLGQWQPVAIVDGLA
ncbi:MAG TPA: TIGR01459 family HAD-type hydrolase [Sphingomicrobium sp.]|nr:TIGR01459 family HAD-type hydrolase [Sphingomicrobium sp.]